MHLYDWITISKSKNLSESFIREHQNSLEWRYIISNQTHLKEDFWLEFKHKIDEVDKLLVQGFSNDFVQEFRNDDGWSAFFNRYKVSEEFINSIENKNKFTWESIFKNQKLTFNFIFENRYKVNMNIIVMFQNLYEDEIIKLFKNLDWNLVYGVSDVNPKDITKFRKNIYNNILRNQCLTQEFIDEYLYTEILFGL